MTYAWATRVHFPSVDITSTFKTVHSQLTALKQLISKNQTEFYCVQVILIIYTMLQREISTCSEFGCVFKEHAPIHHLGQSKQCTYIVAKKSMTKQDLFCTCCFTKYCDMSTKRFLTWGLFVNSRIIISKRDLD